MSVVAVEGCEGAGRAWAVGWHLKGARVYPSFSYNQRMILCLYRDIKLNHRIYNNIL